MTNQVTSFAPLPTDNFWSSLRFSPQGWMNLSTDALNNIRSINNINLSIKPKQSADIYSVLGLERRSRPYDSLKVTSINNQDPY